MQNRHFRSKINNAKKHAKTVSRTHCSCSMQKTAPKKTANIRKVKPFSKLPKMATKNGLCKIVTLGQKLKMLKKHAKPFLTEIKVVICKKRLERKQLNLEKLDHFKNCQK